MLDFYVYVKMDQNACFDIEEISYENRTFYRSTFMDISVIRSDTMFYNATKICKDNGYSGFGQVSRLENWKRHFNAMLTRCKIDPISKKITRMQNLHSGKTSEEIGLIPLTEDDLIFEIKNQQGLRSWMNGVYIHKWLFNHLLSMIDDDYALAIDEIIDLMDEELRLRNLTLEQKIQEKEVEIKAIKENHALSIRGWNSENPGCIVIRNAKNGTYSVYADEKERKAEEFIKSNEIIINGIYNPGKTASLFHIYSKMGHFNNIESINPPFVRGTIDAIKTAITDIQSFSVKYPKIETIIETLKKALGAKTLNLKAKMFEIYCSIVSEIPLYAYTLTELLSLTKQDKGLDLLDIDNRIIGQCKYYISTTLKPDTLAQFMHFCKYYPEFAHKLFVSSGTRISKSVKELANIEIIIIDDAEFNKWYDEQTKELTEIKEGKEEYKNAQIWLKNELESKPFVYVDDAIEYINQEFGLNCNKTSFGTLFAHIYRRNNSYQRSRDTGNDKRFVVSSHRMIPIVCNGEVQGYSIHTHIPLHSEDLPAERALLINTIQYGHYTIEELSDIFVQKLGYPVNSKTIRERHKDLLKTNPKGRCPRRQIGDKRVTIFELKDELVPDKYQKFKEFFKETVSLPTQLQCEQFNKYFHCHEHPSNFEKFKTQTNRL